MTVLFFLLIAFVIGIILLKWIGSKFLFKITPFNIAAILSGTLYYCFPLFFEQFDDMVFTFDYWESAMGAWLLQDAIITAIIYACIVAIMVDIIFKHIEQLNFKIKVIIATVKSLTVLFIVFFHQMNDVYPVSLSPTFWSP